METENEILTGSEVDNAMFDATVTEFEDLFGNAEKLRDFLEVLSDTPHTPDKVLQSSSSDFMYITPGPDIPVVNLCSSDEELEIEDCYFKKPILSVNNPLYSTISSSLDFTSCSSAVHNISSESNLSNDTSSSFSEMHSPCDTEITSDDRTVSPSVAELNFSVQDLISSGVQNVSASHLSNEPDDELLSLSATASGSKEATCLDELKKDQKSNRCDTLATVCVNLHDLKTTGKDLIRSLDSDKDELQSTGIKKVPLYDENSNVVDIWELGSVDVNSPSSSIEELLLAEADDSKEVGSDVTVPVKNNCKPEIPVKGITLIQERVVAKVNECHLQKSICTSEDLELVAGLNPVKEPGTVLEDDIKCLEKTSMYEDQEANLNPVKEPNTVLVVNEDYHGCLEEVEEIIAIQCDSNAGKEPDKVVGVSNDHPKSLEDIVSCEGKKLTSFSAFSNPYKVVDQVSKVGENHSQGLKGSPTNVVKKFNSFQALLNPRNEENVVGKFRDDHCEDLQGNFVYEDKEINPLQAFSNPTKELDDAYKVIKTLGQPEYSKPNLVTDKLIPLEPSKELNGVAKEPSWEPNLPKNAFMSDFPLPSPPIISDLEYDDEPLFPSFRDVAHLPSSLDSSLEVQACTASSDLAPLPIADLSSLLTGLDSQALSGSLLQPSLLKSKVATSSTSVSDDKEIDSFNADSLLFGQEAESELCKLPIGTSEKSRTSPSEGKIAEDVPSWQKPWISTDDAENADNNDPEWDIFRKLETDEERYRVVREKWRQLKIPDPRRDLTQHNFRKPISQNVCKTGKSQLISNDIRMSRKRTRSNTTSEENPAKRRRMLSCTTMYDNKIQNLQQQFDQEVEALRADHQTALKELSICQQQENDRFRFSSYPPYVVRQQMNNLYHRQVRQVEDLQSQFDKRLHCLSRSKQDIINLLDKASREVLTFNKFYNDLGSTDEDHSVITEEEYQQFQETEEMYDLYDQIYTG